MVVAGGGFASAAPSPRDPCVPPLGAVAGAGVEPGLTHTFLDLPPPPLPPPLPPPYPPYIAEQRTPRARSRAFCRCRRRGPYLCDRMVALPEEIEIEIRAPNGKLVVPAAQSGMSSRLATSHPWVTPCKKAIHPTADHPHTTRHTW